MSPKPGDELRTPIRDQIDRQAVEMEDVVNEQLHGLPGQEKFGYGNRMNRFGEAIHHRENHSVAARARETSDKIKGDM